MRWLCALVLLAGCPFTSRRPEPPDAPDRPVPIAGINSAFDDFNSADMSLFRMHRFAFSSNRGSSGAHFDIYDTQLEWANDQLRSITEPSVFLAPLMSERNERGPVAFGASDWDDYSTTYLSWSSDREGGAGGFDLYAVACTGAFRGHRALPCADVDANHRPADAPSPSSPSSPSGSLPALVALAHLNSPRDDAYLTAPFARRHVLFASNRATPESASMSAMDLYSARWDEKQRFVDAPQAIARIEELSSDGDDSAPFVWLSSVRTPDGHDEAEVVFVSDRAGGQGEHDIYCARYDAKTERWSTPKNLGPTINSAKDEYRPIVFVLNSTRFLVFSSTRDGGMGGYDLYVVGYPGCR